MSRHPNARPAVDAAPRHRPVHTTPPTEPGRPMHQRPVISPLSWEALVLPGPKGSAQRAIERAQTRSARTGTSRPAPPGWAGAPRHARRAARPAETRGRLVQHRTRSKARASGYVLASPTSQTGKAQRTAIEALGQRFGSLFAA